MKKKREILEQKRLNQKILRKKIINDSLQTLCQERILQGYIFYKQCDTVATQELEIVNKLYETYHAFGGNIIITSVFEKIIKLPLKEE